MDPFTEVRARPGPACFRLSAGEEAQPGRRRVVSVGDRGDTGQGRGRSGSRREGAAPCAALSGQDSCSWLSPASHPRPARGGVCGLAATLLLCSGETLAAPPLDPCSCRCLRSWSRPGRVRSCRERTVHG